MNVYLLGIAGTGMGSFAGLLRAAGHQVSGSDENVYPPMSDKLAEWRIKTYTPYAAANLEAAKPDLAVVGNVIRAENPEAKALRRRGIPHMSFPEALEELFLASRHPVVVTGTHGKTTTTSLLAQVLHHAGRDPSLLVGGVPLNFNEGFRLGKGEHFVLEGASRLSRSRGRLVRSCLPRFSRAPRHASGRRAAQRGERPRRVRGVPRPRPASGGDRGGLQLLPRSEAPARAARRAARHRRD